MAIKYLSNIDMGGNKITNLGTPTAASDVTTKSYVDGLVNGVAWKDSARVASIANVNVASAPASIDGIALVAGDRVLLKDQTVPAQNGIYTFSAAASPLVRGLDADSQNELLGAAVFVEEGTHADQMWTLTTDAPITVDTTALAFTQFSSAGALTGGAGVIRTGDTIHVELSTGGGGKGLQFSGGGLTGANSETLEVRIDDVSVNFTGGGAVQVKDLGISTGKLATDAVTTVKIANSAVDENKLNASVAGAGLTGGGGTALAVGAGTGIAVNANDVEIASAFRVKRASALCSAAATQSFNHALNSADVIFSCREISTGDLVMVEHSVLAGPDLNNIEVRFAVAPTAGQYRFFAVAQG